MSDSTSESGPVRLTVTQLIDDLHNGLTRCKGDTGYNPDIGSVEEKYGLSKTDVRELFKSHPKLKGLRVRTPKEQAYELIDDTAENNSDNEPMEESDAPKGDTEQEAKKEFDSQQEATSV